MSLVSTFSEISTDESLRGLCLLMSKQANINDFNPKGLQLNHPRLTEFVRRSMPYGALRYFVERINRKVVVDKGGNYKIYYYGKR